MFSLRSPSSLFQAALLSALLLFAGAARAATEDSEAASKHHHKTTHHAPEHKKPAEAHKEAPAKVAAPVAVGAAAAGAAATQEVKPKAKAEAPKEPPEPPMKLPAFAALKFDETNLRRGPGTRYPIDWVYYRRNLPLEIERTYDIWRYVRDPDGVQGWVLQVQLTERRSVMIKDGDATLRSDASEKASPVALLKPGVIARLRRCDKDSAWCQVEVSGYKGYIRRDQVWGLLPDEEVAPS
jgi:SH3-like domain-containing protein